MEGRRTYGSGGLTQRPDGRWEATAWIEDDTGRRRRHFYGWTAEEAQAKLDHARRVSERGGRVADDRLTVGKYLDEWLAYSATRVRPATLRYNRQNVRLYLRPAFGNVRLARLTPRHVAALMASMRADGLSARTCAMAHDTLRNALNHARRQGLVERNVATAIRPPRDETREMAALTPEQVQRLFAATADDRQAAAYVVATLTGLRQGEMLAMRWWDVDLEAGTLAVAGTLTRRDGVYRVEATKTARSRRTVTLSPMVVDALRAHRLAQLEERVSAGRDWRANDLVFCTPHGDPQSGTSLTHALQRHCADAGLPRIRWHDLRHTAATLMLMSGAPLRVVMEVLGHSTIVLTANLYAHVTPTMTRSSAEAVELLVRGAG